MNNATVSVIVPVYNAEKTLRKCLDSILNQTFADFELILVNDGSKDSSLSILREYAARDSRISVIDKPNEGASQSRNRGIDSAVGEFLIFIDSDDYIALDYIARLYAEITAGKLDMVISGFYSVNEVGQCTGSMKLKAVDSEWSKFIITTPWARIIRKSVLIDHGLRFINYTMEDIHFNMLFFSKTKKVKVIDYIGYYYVFNQNSITHTLHKGITKDVDILYLLSDIHSHVLPDEWMKMFYRKSYVYYLLYSGKYASPSQFMSEYHRITGWIKGNQLVSNMSPFDQRLKGERVFVRWILFGFSCLETCHLLPLFAKLYCKGQE